MGRIEKRHVNVLLIVLLAVAVYAATPKQLSLFANTSKTFFISHRVPTALSDAELNADAIVCSTSKAIPFSVVISKDPAMQDIVKLVEVQSLQLTNELDGYYCEPVHVVIAAPDRPFYLWLVANRDVFVVQQVNEGKTQYATFMDTDQQTLSLLDTFVSIAKFAQTVVTTPVRLIHRLVYPKIQADRGSISFNGTTYKTSTGTTAKNPPSVITDGTADTTTDTTPSKVYTDTSSSSSSSGSGGGSHYVPPPDEPEDHPSGPSYTWRIIYTDGPETCRPYGHEMIDATGKRVYDHCRCWRPVYRKKCMISFAGINLGCSILGVDHYKQTKDMAADWSAYLYDESCHKVPMRELIPKYVDVTAIQRKIGVAFSIYRG